MSAIDAVGASAAPEAELVKDIQRFIWSQGDYGELARESEPAAEAVARALGVGRGLSVLDVAAGNGNLAVAAARRGARVVATDLTPRMVELGRARCAAEGLDVEWLEADAEALPFADHRFDRVASIFGAALAPRPELVTLELFRVTAPGGLVALAMWTPDGFIGRMIATISRYVPRPPGQAPPPVTWGQEETVRSRLAPFAAELELTRLTVPIARPSIDDLVGFYERVNGPLVAARTVCGDRYPELARELRAAIAEFDVATDGSVLIHAEYLLAIARRA